MYQANETNTDWNSNHIILTVEASGIDAAILGVRNTLRLKTPSNTAWYVTIRSIKINTNFEQTFSYTLDCYKVGA